MVEKQLGMQWKSRPEGEATVVDLGTPATNARTALWPTRWPAIALQECIDEVEAAPLDERAEVKFNLPCADCRMNTQCLNAKRKELGPLLYDREIMTEPRSSESSLFPREIWAPMLGSFPCTKYWQAPFSLEHEFKVGQAWDLAWSERTGGDFLVCITGSIHLPTGKRRILDLQRWQRISFDDQIALIEQQWRQFGADGVVIESDAAQQIWAQKVANDTPVPVLRHDAGTKRDLAAGVPSILIQLSNRKWEIPWMPGQYHHDEIENMINEFEAFGWNEGKLEGVGEHDDTLMAFWHLSWMLDRLVKFPQGGREYHSGHVGGARL